MLHNQTVMLQNALGFTQLSLMKDFDGQFPQQRPSLPPPWSPSRAPRCDPLRIVYVVFAFGFAFVPADG
jgi:hypothetical protein